MEDKRVLMSIKDLGVKFRVRGRILSAIRGVSLDIYENETLAIVGESGCGKSVFTQALSGTLDNNGFIDRGEIIFNDKDLTEVTAPRSTAAEAAMRRVARRLDGYSRLELGAATFRRMLALESEEKACRSLGEEDAKAYEAERDELVFRRTEANNLKLAMDRSSEKAGIKEASAVIADCDARIKALDAERRQKLRERARAWKLDASDAKSRAAKKAELKALYSKECADAVSAAAMDRNRLLAKEIYLSVSRYPARRRPRLRRAVYAAFRKAMRLGVDLGDEAQLNRVFESAVFRVRLVGETRELMHGNVVLNLAKKDLVGDWTDIRGKKVAMIFQDPMTSLNPILTIGSQITSAIVKHQRVSETEARKRAIILMRKVGIPNAQDRFDDYPFQYSGGMRQRVVIAIALSCQPKVLVCDEPTTALDVTIQAQILRLIKDLQKEFRYTAVFITHDLGVVANVADRVAIIYAGQIIELGTAEDVFYDPRHPYTWVLLSSLPQLSERDRELFSIAGTPPSLYNRIVGDAFAPRNPYCLKVDTIKEPPMFKVSDTHFAKTWLLDPRAPQVDKPENIRDINGRLKKVFNLQGNGCVPQ